MDPLLFSQHSKPKVLLVDDSESNLLALEVALKELDCEVKSFSSGLNALEFLNQNEVAVVLLDVKMPIIDGFEVARRAREISHSQITPILFITGTDPSDEQLQKAYDVGGSDYITKPVNVRVLKAKVSLFLELFRARALHAQKERADVEEKYKDLVENVNHAIIWSLNPQQQVFTFVSPHAQEITGHSLNDWSQKEFLFQQVPIEDHSLLRNLFEDCRSGIDRGIEHRFLHKDGRVLWLHTGARLVRQGSDRTLEIRGLSTDITEIMEAKAQVDASEEKFRLLSDSMPQMVFMVDTHGGSTHFNKRWYEYTGLEPGPHDPGYDDILHPEDKAQVFEKWYESKHAGKTWVHEYRLKGKDGKFRWHLGRSIPYKDDHGKIQCWIGTVTDIHDQKVIAEKAAKNEQRLNMALEAANLGFWDYHLITQELNLSDRMFLDWGIDKSTFDGQLSTAIGKIHPEDQNRVISEIEKAISHRVDYDIEYRVIRKPDQIIWIRAQGRVRMNSSGEPTQFTGTSLNITKEKLAAIEIKNKEAEFRTLANTIPQLAWMAHPDGNIFWLNDQWVQYTGKSFEALMGTGWQTLHEPESLNHTRSRFSKSVQSGASDEIEFALRSKTGEYRWFLARYASLKDENDRVLRWFGTNTDIHEQRLLRHDQQFRADLTLKLNAAENLSELAIIATQSLAKYLKTHRCFLTELQGNVATVLTDHAQDLPSMKGQYDISSFGPEMVKSWKSGHIVIVENVETDPRIQESASAHLALGISSFVTVPLNRAGELVGALNVANLEPRKWSEREVELIRIVADSVWSSFERARLLEALRASHRRSEFLAKASNVLNTSLDVEKVLRTLSDLTVPDLADWSSLRMLDGQGTLKQVVVSHRDPEKVKWGWELQKLFPPDPQAVNGAYQVLRTGKPEFVAEVTEDIIRSAAKTQEQCEMLLSIGFKAYICVPIMSRGQAVGTMTLVVTEESGRKFTAEDFSLAIELGVRAGLAVENARLYVEAQAVNRLKDEFLANLSHELRTPMNVIQGHAEILRHESNLSELEVRESLDAIERNAKAQNALIADLLDVSAIITGKISYRPVNLNPSETVQKVLESLKPIADSKGIRLISDFVHAPALVVVDSTRFHQIIWNLLSNAVKFTGDDGRIDVQITADEQAWSLIVSDTGKGIDKNFLPYVFDRFRQEDASTTRQFGGLGLGLSVVRNLVNLHNGTVRAESPGKGQGARFTVTFPRHVVKDPVKKENDVKAATDALKTSDDKAVLQGLGVLLVEDSLDNRILISRILTKAGARVVEAESASIAREKMKDFHPNVIISDIGMPDENGLQFIQKLRVTSQIPAIALTAYVRPEEKEAALVAGFQAHLGKPLNAKLLVQEVMKLASNKL